MSIMIIGALYKRNNKLQVLISVPTEVLKEQWQRELAKHQLFQVCKVEIINTIVKNTYSVDLLVIDEIHSIANERGLEIFSAVSYRYIVGLTATLERLDGNHKLLTPYLQVCDTITLQDALENNWVSNYRNYKVLVKVDLTQYNEYNQKFQHFFAYFSHDFKLMMELLQSPKKLKIWAKKQGKEEGIVRGCLSQAMKYLKLRKSFVMSHEKKFEIANKILDYRKDKKCILFTATVKDAESFKSRGLICHSKRSKKDNKSIIEYFNSINTGVIVSPTSLRTGVDIKGLSVGITVSGNSSQILGIQALGRVVRKEDDKIAEFFTLVVANSCDELWFNNANKNQPYITINEDQLDLILQGKEISTRPKRGIVDIENRY